MPVILGSVSLVSTREWFQADFANKLLDLESCRADVEVIVSSAGGDAYPLGIAAEIVRRSLRMMENIVVSIDNRSSRTTDRDNRLRAITDFIHQTRSWEFIDVEDVDMEGG